MRRAATDEVAFARIGRRLVTVPLFLVVGPLLVALAPVWLPLLAAVDAVRGGRWSAVRAGLALTHYALGETLGLVASAALAPLDRIAPDRGLDAHFRLQWWWAHWLLGGAARIFDLRIDATGVDALRGGPVLVLLRHASVLDTLLPAAIGSRRTGLRLRYVMKRELLWDACLDVVGQRLPNAFVRRGRGGDAAEIARVRALARDLGPRDGVVLYPEGTRYTPQRRAQVLARLAAAADAKLVERARALHRVLPPRLGGALALLESAPDADVAIGVHTGLESLRSLADLWRGTLIGRRIELAFWRIPAAEIPTARADRVEWLYDQWQRVDAWLAARSAP